MEDTDRHQFMEPEECEHQHPRYMCLVCRDSKAFLRFVPDPNNGAGLWAVFLGDFPIHHFRANACVSKYMDNIRRNLEQYAAANLK